MNLFKSGCLLGLAIVFACSQAKTEKKPSLSIFESATQAQKIVNESISKHGDLSSDSLKITIRLAAEEGIHRGQSLVPLPPYETYVLERTYAFDKSKGIEYAQGNNRFAGFDFHWAFSNLDGEGKAYDINTRTYMPRSSSGINNYRYFPHTYLNRAISNPRSLTLNGKTTCGNAECWEIAFKNGSEMARLLIDVNSSLVKQFEQLRNFPPYGDGFSRISFTDYAKFGSLMLPQQIVSGGRYGAWDEMYNTFRIEKLNESASEIVAKTDYSEFTQGDYSYRPNSEFRELAENVFLIENVTNSSGQWSYNVMIVEFDEFVLVCEAPVSADISENVLETISEKFDDKPVKYLVQSHHHDDHWAGIRRYMAEGTTIISTDGNKELLTKISTAPFRLAPDKQWEEPKPLDMMMVEGKTDINAAGNLVEIHDVGPTGHANEMLTVYLPKQKLLWQADMINYGEWSMDNPLKDGLVQKIKELGLEVETIVGLHGRVLDGEQLKKVLEG